MAKRLGVKRAQYIKGVGARTGQGHGQGKVGKSRQEEVRGWRAQEQGRAGRGSSEVEDPGEWEAPKSSRKLWGVDRRYGKDSLERLRLKTLCPVDAGSSQDEAGPGEGGK